MIGNRNKNLQTFFIVVIYAACFYSIQFFFHRTEMLPVYPTAKNLDLWDASLYNSIATGGYQKGSYNNGFFPLFPLIWHLMHVNVIGICIVNILLFAVGFTILTNIYSISITDKLIWLSIPSLYFVFIPYSEALFFLLVSCCLYGLVNKKQWIIQLSLLLVSLTRATAVFLLPAFLLMELLTTKNLITALKTYIKVYVPPIITGLLIFMYYQYLVTGNWFTYFILQSTSWGHSFDVPTLPFATMDGFKRIWVSALGIFVGLISAICAVIYIIKRISKNKVFDDKLLTLSLLYLSAILVLTAFFNPTWGSYTTNLMGMHRYTMATPFFFVFLYHFTNNIEYKLRHFIFVFIVANIAWLSCGAYLHILTYLFFTFNTIFIFFYMAYANKRLSWPSLAIFAINVFLQLHMLQQFIGNIYPD